MRDFHLPGRSAVFAANGICATSHPLAALVAVEILKFGGNAADAAIAAAGVLGIAEPMMCGIGGDMFALIKPAGDDRIVALNGSGRAPKAATAAALCDQGLARVPLQTVDAITVPGGIDGLCTLSSDWGKLGLDQVLAPAIHYAENGVPVAPRTWSDWQNNASKLIGIARRYHLFDDTAPKLGQIWRHPQQAAALRQIAAKGRAGFYEGEVADDMVASLRALGGLHTAEDFAATRATYGDPISGLYNGIELVEHPPNGQGATAILMANILSHFDLADLDPRGAMRAHLEAEAAKLAYDARNRILADPDHTNRLAHMLAPETARKLAQLIRRDAVLPDPAPLTESIHKDTVYLTVIDRDGMAVSLIYSIFNSFGSGLASSKFGILFHNRGSGFTLEQGHPNELAGGKRPMHTIIPAMLRKNGKLTHTLGVMGGAYQAAGHVRMLSNLTDFGMDLQTAIEAPRSFPDAGTLQMERGYTPEVCAQLADIGHKISEPPTAIGGAQSIEIDYENGVLIGASDHRKDGCALGY